MADLNNFELGEYIGPVSLVNVEFTDTATAGDFLVISGVNSDGQLQVAKQSTDGKPRFFVPKGSDGVNGDIRQVVAKGRIIVGFDGTVATGGNVGIDDNLAKSPGSGVSAKIGYSITKAAAQGDTGLIYFDGEQP